jgi:hypothetical protein
MKTFSTNKLYCISETNSTMQFAQLKPGIMAKKIEKYFDN